MSSIIDIFGFHNQWISNNQGLVDARDKTNYLHHNVTIILGYVPIVGLFIGIMEIAKSRKEMQKDISSERYAGNALLITRGVISILGIGAIMLLPDLIITAIRVSTARNRSNIF